MARYINAFDGLSQVQALLGSDVPADLTNCDRFLTVSFRYFTSAIELFSDKMAMEMYEDRATLLKHVSQLDDDRKVGHIAACLVFYKEPGCAHGTFDSPVEISRAYDWSLRNAAAHFEPRSYWGITTNILSCVNKLKYLVHHYSSQANIMQSNSSYDIFGTNDNLFEEEIILDSYAEGLSLTIAPHPDTAKEEEMYWMSRQLAMCEAKTKEEVNLGSDSLHEAAMLFLLHDDAPLSNKFFSAALRTCFRRAQLLLHQHHEFADLSSSDAPVVGSYRQQIELNVATAASFAFAVVFDEMSTSQVYPGLVRLMGEADKQTWNSEYAILVPNEATQHLVTLFSFTLSSIGT